MPDVKPMKVLMVMGATGAGKSTLLNAIANHVLGTRWTDNFRFKLIVEKGTRSPDSSQTRNITAYAFHDTDMPFNLTIVDTPGFGDTGGIERDKEIVKQIKKFFSGEDECSIDQLHGVGFVTKASDSRLTPTQHYIYDSILSIFGIDMHDNIFLMITFADGGYSPVLSAVKDIPYKESFKFNNSALYSSDNDTDEVSFDSMFWKMGYSSSEKFFDAFSKAERQTLTMTREVLKERDELETLIPGLQDRVKIGMLQMEVIEEEKRIITQFQAEINANKDFTYKIKTTQFEKVALKPGIHTTTCTVCNFTCHKNCKRSDDKDKRGCWAMDKSGNCRICPKYCIWSLHTNIPFIHIYSTVWETHTYKDLKKKHDIAEGEKKEAKKFLAENEEKLTNMQVEVYLQIERAQKSIKRLEQIALKPNPLTTVQYLDLLIESEKQQVKPGWEKRVQQYVKFRADAELYKKVAISGVDSVDLVKSDKAKVEQYLAKKSPAL